MNTTEAIVQEQLDAYNSRDLELFLSFYSDDIVILDFPGEKVTISGKEALRNVYKEMFENSPKLHCEIVSRIVFDDKVLDHERVSGRYGVDLVEVVAIYKLREGLISSVHFVRKNTK
ncbi:SgcJ/EcaC family oxidoreductase [Aquimarina hainanensis]|uniref:SgcJ/EcaC family oxidoreductase n=1 Tax=Aquimarina hainanensis TaxID=1578017 RepID=A0ABW5N335_9FLAO|nr:SgcJ/EcaC family oxidoreductase [Aquimarina sp. TRL1]QKX05955.1 SgcJ/EcaC family oxidoreductase [Aquimarina sp. TRL1]